MQLYIFKINYVTKGNNLKDNTKTQRRLVNAYTC